MWWLRLRWLCLSARLIPEHQLISDPKSYDLHANEACCGLKWSCVCVLCTGVCSLQLIKAWAAIDYSHVAKQPLFFLCLIKDSTQRKTWFIFILRLVWVRRKMELREKRESSSWSTLHYTTCSLPSLSVSVGMFDRKSVTKHLYSRHHWEIIKFK